jgi:tetratricopeptide (TPR) repeat protein
VIPVGARWPGALAALLALAANQPAGAQRLAATDDVRRLREATRLETAGDLDGATRVLNGLLDESPENLSALLAYERVLGMQGRLEELLPAIAEVLEQDPGSAIAHQMRVRALSSLDRVDDLEQASAAWVAAAPNVETPYREIARVWRTRGELVRAADVLKLGRKRIEREDALALELGDVYAAAGDVAGAVREWDRAIGPDGHGFLLVQRRVQMLPNGGATLLPQLVHALAQPPSSIARRKAAALLAMEAGLAETAERIARSVLAELEGAERGAYTVEVARRADGNGLERLAYFAYGQMLEFNGTQAQLLAVRNRYAELALAVGDTSSAAAMYRDLEAAFAPDSPQRRQALAVRIGLSARSGEPAGALRELETFRGEFPNAPELDAVAAAVSNGFLDAGDVPSAERAIGGIDGPHTGLARGRIYLRRGETERARAELLEAAPLLHGAEATEAIALATLMGRLSPQGGQLLARAMAGLAEGDPDRAARVLLEESADLSADERPAVLEFAAGLADRGALPDRAELIRREIVAEHPASREAPAALLSLARSLALRDRAVAEARGLLERLILEYPRSALVPQARSELDRLQSRTPGS